MNINQIDTPALLIDQNVALSNINYMKDYAEEQQVALRPHTKTHKMPYFAHLQCDNGAAGITVAKTGEAETMADHGIDDIFIANQVVGATKLNKIKALSDSITVSFGTDNIAHIEQINQIFGDSAAVANVLIEIEVGEKRSGVIEDKDFIELIEKIKQTDSIHFKGVFSHDGHTYKASDKEHCKSLYLDAVDRTLHFAELAREHGLQAEVVSVGSTPPFMFGFDIPGGVTEIRPGTYIFMDGSQSNAINDKSHCAATVLSTVISKPTYERVITDVGAKGITMQQRNKGLTTNEGLGQIMEYHDVYIDSVFDEHAIIYNRQFHDIINIGDKIRILPNHICPVTNLYDSVYLIENEKVVDKINVACRGDLQ